MDDVQRQLRLEEEMVLCGATRFRERIAQARQDATESLTPSGRRLLKSVLVPMSEAVSEFFLQSSSGKAGRHLEAYSLAGHMDASVLAYLTVKSIVDSITRRKSLQNSAVSIGRLIEDEARLLEFEKVNRQYFKAVSKRVGRASSYQYRRTVMIHAMSTGLGIEWEPWTNTQLFHVGMKMIDLLMQSTDVVHLDRANGSTYYLLPTDDIISWLTKENESMEMLCPTYLPMVSLPKPWTNPTDGGYLSPIVSRPNLVKAYDPKYLKDLESAEMPVVYAAVNGLQATPWRINTQVLQVAEQLWEAGLELAGFPNRDDVEPSPCPLNPEEKANDLAPDRKTLFQEWKLHAAHIHEANIQSRSKRMRIARILGLCRRFSDEQSIYFPYTLDFRGRVYAIPMFLNPQGDDLARGCLTFSEGKPITLPEHREWLAIHGANTYGYDKVSLEDRVRWVEDNTRTILSVAMDPLSNLFWTEADKPFQFLAFCFEWAGYTTQGYGYVSSLPVQLDGSCNGLQHFSAMLRDEVGGRAVNLIPSATPQDIYQTVADVVLRKLKEILDGLGDLSIAPGFPESTRIELAQRWLEYGIDRKLTKRPVMILPYGGTKVAMRSYIEDAILEKSPQHFSDTFQACRFMSDVVWAAIGEVVVSAQVAMAWLREAASAVSKEGKDIHWSTPLGFPVVQRYRSLRSVQVRTKLSGSVIMPSLVSETNKLDSRKQVNGISPNFIHSLDAAALHMYAAAAVENGITNLSVIHDSYGTLAADTGSSLNILRDCFVRLYSRTDILADFRYQIQSQTKVQLRAVPPGGKLNIEQVRESKFFFA